MSPENRDVLFDFVFLLVLAVVAAATVIGFLYVIGVIVLLIAGVLTSLPGIVILAMACTVLTILSWPR